jgi:hypothetical protein
MVRHHCDGCGYEWSTFPHPNLPGIHVARHVLSSGAYCTPLPMTVENNEYTRVCVLRRCGGIDGCATARLPVYDTDAAGNIVEMPEVDGKRIVLAAIWQQINSDTCALSLDGHCLMRYKCERGQTYCYPVPLHGKRANRIVASMFASYCVDIAIAARKAAYDVLPIREAFMAEVAAATAVGSARKAAEADATKDAAEAASNAASSAADAADVQASAGVARARAHAVSYDKFFLAASNEIEKLVAAWGTPIRGGQ